MILINLFEGFNFNENLAFSVSPFPIIKGILPPALNSSKIVIGLSLKTPNFFPFLSVIFFSLRFNSTTSPVFNFDTSHSTGKAPESSNVLKKIGAIFVPKIIPPEFLFGM